MINIFFIYIIVKIFLDIFSPFREINMIIELGLSMLLFKNLYNPSILKLYKFKFVILYFLLYCIISGFNLQSIKFTIGIIFFYSCLLAGYKISVEKIGNICFKVAKIGLIFLSASIAISFAIGIYGKRQIYNFEHVNLFGSYVVIMSLLLITSIYLKKNTEQEITPRKILIYKLSFAIIAFFSTSTGAFLVQMLIFIPRKFFSIKNSLRLSLLVFVSVLTLYHLSANYSPTLHQKIFGTIDVFKSYSFKDFYEASASQDNKALTEAMELGGSFTWRLNTYIFYYASFIKSSFIQMISGGGAANYLNYAYFMPHNDFIAIILDFGIIGLITLTTFLYRNYKFSFINKFDPFVYFFIILVLRLAFENCIYSFYLLSFCTSVAGLIIGILQALRKNVITSV